MTNKINSQGVAFKILRSIFVIAALLIIIEGRNASLFARQQDTSAQSSEARRWLKDGVNAYKEGRTDEAIEDFQRAKTLDPLLLNAQLYLATAYSAQYMPGAPSPENIQNANLALQEFQSILKSHPNNLSAIDGAGSILYNMSYTPFDASKMEESKNYHRKHIELKPEDPEPYYWMGVIDWSLAFRANRSLRDSHNRGAGNDEQGMDPMPAALAVEFQQKYGEIVDEGIANLKKAMELRRDYDDAMAYLNLLYRQRADMELHPADRDRDLKEADGLVEQVKIIKGKKMQETPAPQ